MLICLIWPTVWLHRGIKFHKIYLFFKYVRGWFNIRFWVVHVLVACENIRFFSLFAAGDVSRETSPAAKSVDKRMFSQATSTCTTQNLKPAETASKWLEKRTDCGTDNTNKRLVIFIFEYFQKAESEFRT